MALGLLLFAPQKASAQAAPSRGPVSFVNDVAPILKENCFACHDSKKRKGKLDMTTYANLRKGGDKDDPVAPGKPEDSVILDLVTKNGAGRMPPRDAGEALPKEKIAVIAQWIKEGAKLDAGIKPEADLWRELRLRWKPPAPPAAYRFPINVNALAFTPDSLKLVVGGYHELTIWDVAQAKLIKRINTRAERAYAMAFLKDGKLAVAGGRPGQEGDVRIYDINAGAPKMLNGVPVVDGVNDRTVLIAELLETDDSVLCLAISPDGKKLAAGGCDRLVKVWDLTPGYAKARLEQTIENHADWVFGVVFTPDGKRLITGSRDKTAKVWDLTTKESVLTFPDHQNGVYGVAVGMDGKVGFSAGEDNQLRMWNATGDGKQIRPLGGHGKAIFKIAERMDPKSPLLATCSADGTVRLWNPVNGQNVKTLNGHTDWVYAVAISPDGKLVAAGSWNGEVRTWTVADGKPGKMFNASPGYVPSAKK
jgi:WD40 repeat protein/mono/diheme cytochrome c family protein